ncbi:hypothetical protein GCM10010383_49550 [Streptomyces lomondensis]|uniref:Uncharacterized protein n=1 Tax=Streptomyces lomondensis TaxID=68229 RepID=A0ABQ2XEV5_9ACTN|nr:hypothetical protein GCM10010383_49550 [Streptomyces lomondensis]
MRRARDGCPAPTVRHDAACRATVGSCSDRLRAFDELAAFEAGSGADEGDEVGCVHGPPPLLGGLDELEAHGGHGTLELD